MAGNRFAKRMAFSGKAVPFTPGLRITAFVIRGLQFVASIVSAGILSYFIWKLREVHLSVPWSFCIELAVAIISILVLFIMAIKSFPNTPSPYYNLISNGILTGLWALALGVLLGTTKITMLKACSWDTWHNDIGMSVCHLYKALFAFQVSSLGLTIIAVVFDFFTFRTYSASGAYIRTENPKFAGVQGDDSEYRGLTAPSMASSAPYSQASFRSPHTPDDRSPGFPNTPQNAAYDEDITTTHLMAPHAGVERARYYASPQPSPPPDSKRNSMGYGSS
ncbi:hypothetical protein F5884DRAFT_897211 [Xylogone sp. PMI_703]|nr:hypothetical protein F5884DRAFT_897211 [Xylogone sp. PMI_703]